MTHAPSLSSLLALAVASLACPPPAAADVGLILVNQENHREASGDRFRVSVRPNRGVADVHVFVPRRDGEKLIRADLSVTEGDKPRASMPIATRAAKNDIGFYITMQMDQTFAERCRLSLLIDSTTQENVGTSYMIELGTYFPATRPE